MSNEEQSYMAGYSAAWMKIVREAMLQLGYDADEVAGADWLIERKGAIAALRDVCGDFGDNDWDDSLNLADIIEKHLAKHLHQVSGRTLFISPSPQPVIYDIEWENIQPIHWLSILHQIPISDCVTRIPFYTATQYAMNEIELIAPRPIVSSPNPFDTSHYATMKFRKMVEPNASKKACWERIL